MVINFSSKPLHIIILLLHFLFVLRLQEGIVFCNAQSSPQSDGDVLQIWKREIEDGAQALRDWDNPSSAGYCQYTGVQCGATGRVRSLNISGLGLSGPITTFIGDLTELDNLDLSNNNFDGAIPTEIGRLLSLQVMALQVNNLTSSIPDSLGNLTRLKSLTLGNNSLTGGVPEALTKLTSLEVLSVPANQLEGQLTEDLGNLGNLTHLILESNKLNGSIPQSLGRLTNLRVLNLGNNSMSGEVPWGNLTRLREMQELTLYSNSFSGNLADNFGQLSNLQILNLHGNGFNGTIPDNICVALVNLRMLQLNKNEFQGELPIGIGRCSRLETVDINSNHLFGSIPTSIGNCSSLRQIIAWNNNFTGQIPHQVGDLTQLVDFNFDVNNLVGVLPSELGNLTQLRTLQLSLNAFTGNIPKELGRLSNLKFLNLGSSFLNGSIPPELFDSTFSLEEIHLDLNLLTGNIPATIGKARSLTILWLHYNQLNGSIPDEIGNLTSLTTLSLGNNSLSGKIPDALGKLTNLMNFDLALNEFTGEIPPFLQNFSQLKAIWLHDNKLHGEIPVWLASLTNLQYLYLGENSLRGTIPEGLGQLTNLISLGLNECNLTGSIPRSLSNLTKLEFLNLEYNSLQGNITVDFSNFSSPAFSLILAGNELTGNFPASLQDCSLYILDLSSNQLDGLLPNVAPNSLMLNISVFSIRSNNFSGPVPAWIWTLQNVTILDLSDNKFTSPMPSSFLSLQALQQSTQSYDSSLDKVTDDEHKPMLVFDVEFHVKGGLVTYTYVLASNTLLDLSNNKFSGQIPSNLGDLRGLRLLNFSRNQLDGAIPGTLGLLEDLEQLDLSDNNLSGEIPSTLSELHSLAVLDLSNNNLSGAIPQTDNFNTRFLASAFAGNSLLCGFPLAACIVDGSDGNDTGSSCSGSLCHAWARAVLGTFLALIVATVAATVAMILLLRRQRRSSESDFTTYLFRDHHEYDAILKVDFKGLAYHTNGFEFSNYETLGVGGSSVVYKVPLPETTIALKKLNLERHEHLKKIATLEFDRELETLGSLRHRNLVKLLGFCSTSTMKAIMLEYMENGSLDKHLYGPGNKPLSWKTRLDIASGVVEALYYLHHGCQFPVIHLDLKPSNILLNYDMIPKVGDFGLAKFVKSGAGTGDVTASNVCGSTGYIPPEYASTMKVSTKGDVYSFGVVLLELLSRKRPTDLGGDMTIRQWFVGAFPMNLSLVLDQQLLEESETMSDVQLKQISLLTRIGLLCTVPQPSDRPTMVDVKAMLEQIRAENGFTHASLVKYPSLQELAAVDHEPRTIRFNDTEFVRTISK
ncbi:hypothetical protein MPTK1_8g05420 [Marchantia polymorpha subsp. ruderalis]|uniref:non-specific serine/threonine protein kinase n=1 Tax=Marchantia polymorpha TaxID=3197 RepID=A0A2R6WKD3_MARPO|nr:hypothetical protein MARPO_0081s0043 [Marchantia polymorpha]BBN18777.1 hypothetical protein Mp_8g05420 [Marchantia polymorpha subsp. ruderalis]|eukprot:PTQ34316.1 hypothetical protein MARPO_0081s0043 [Marchantia polymorpha]